MPPRVPPNPSPSRRHEDPGRPQLDPAPTGDVVYFSVGLAWLPPAIERSHHMLGRLRSMDVHCLTSVVAA